MDSTSSPPEILDTDVAIVGGGLAGLTTAVGLSRAGLDCLLVERHERLGGRARSWTDPTTGDPVHIGPHIFLSKYPNMLELLDWLGTRDRIVWQDDHFITIADGRETFRLEQYPLPAPFHFLPSILVDERIGHEHKLSNVPVTLYAMQMDEQDVMRLDGMNAYAFLKRMGVTEKYIRQFWAFTSRAIMNVPIEICSAGALLRFFKRFIGHNEFSFGFPDGGLGDLFAPQAEQFIRERGNEVLLETEVEAFATAGGRVEGLHLADGRRVRAETTVAALPPTALRRLVPREWTREYEMFGELGFFQPSRYASPYVWFDRKLTDRMMWAREHRNYDLNCDFYDLSNIVSGWEDRASVITSNIIWADRIDGMSDDEIVEETVYEISEFLPEASMDRVEHSRVNRIPMAIHCPFPGTERRRPPTRSPVDDLLLAGDWIQTHLPASMESACMAGWMAADEVLESRRGDSRLAVEHPKVEGLTAMVERASTLMRPRRVGRRMLQVAMQTDWLPILGGGDDDRTS